MRRIVASAFWLICLAAPFASGAATLSAAENAGARGDEASLQREYAAVRAALAPHFDDFKIDDDRRAVDWLDRLWTLTGDWAARWLEAHPGATAGALATAVSTLEPELSADVLPLGDGFLVATRRGELGNVVLVAPERHGYRAVWNVKDVLRSWSAAGARARCVDDENEDDDDCGGWMPALGALPADGSGRARFFVDATAGQYAGSTVGAELTIWTWDGTRAALALRHAYSYALDDDAGTATHLDGDELVLREKRAFRAFFGSGGSPHRRVETRIHLTPTDISEPESQSLDPELDTLDELFVRLVRGEPTDELATPEAAALVAEQIDWEALDPAEPRLGMLMADLPADHGSTFCVEIEGIGSIRYKFERRGERMFIVAADLRCGE
ncbi:MAG TPA: hypothetical protein VGS57_08880 [Thermoanaerobaculia bacterium]|jgi:hypothetical protein|nr:hypothetical protein [Thermoanaerobaculia bacterium]